MKETENEHRILLWKERKRKRQENRKGKEKEKGGEGRGGVGKSNVQESTIRKKLTKGLNESYAILKKAKNKCENKWYLRNSFSSWNRFIWIVFAVLLALVSISISWLPITCRTYTDFKSQDKNISTHGSWFGHLHKFPRRGRCKNIFSEPWMYGPQGEPGLHLHILAYICSWAASCVYLQDCGWCMCYPRQTCAYKCQLKDNMSAELGMLQFTVLILFEILGLIGFLKMILHLFVTKECYCGKALRPWKMCLQNRHWQML